MLQFTKEIKENWLKDLKSGEFVRFEGRLRESENSNKMCCLGVLTRHLKGVKISDGGDSCVVDGKDVGYEPFKTLLGAQVSGKLWGTNDRSVLDTYDAVIPIIESLPTVD